MMPATEPGPNRFDTPPLTNSERSMPRSLRKYTSKAEEFNPKVVNAGMPS